MYIFLILIPEVYLTLLCVSESRQDHFVESNVLLEDAPKKVQHLVSRQVEDMAGELIVSLVDPYDEFADFDNSDLIIFQGPVREYLEQHHLLN